MELRGYKLPVDGKGYLAYYARSAATQTKPSLVFRFSSRRKWTGGDSAPFAWRLIEPNNELKFPILELVADRHTTIHPPSNYDFWGLGPKPSINTPYVQVLRPQVEGTIPQEEEAFNHDTILGNTGRVYGSTIRDRPIGSITEPDVHKFRIDHLPLGNQGKAFGRPACLITNILNHYQLRLYVKDIWKPAAYWNVILTDPETLKGSTAFIGLYIDRNITAKNIWFSEKFPVLEVGVLLLGGHNSRAAIPFYTGRVTSEDNNFNDVRNGYLVEKDPKRIKRERPDGYWWRKFVQGAEDLIGLVPMWGDVYDVGSIAYMSATGKAPWTGDPVPRTESTIYAAAVLGPISVSQVRRFREFSMGLPKKFRGLADDAFRDYMEKIMGPEFALEVASAATEANIRQLRIKLLAATGASTAAKKISSGEFATYFMELLRDEVDISDIAQRYSALKRYTRIDEIFTEVLDLKEPLLTRYEVYLKRTKQTREHVSPLEWTRQQYSGAPAEALHLALGTNYLGKLRVLAGTAKSLAATPSREVIERAVKRLKAGPLKNTNIYTDLAKDTPHLYPLVERDHITEKRFFLNNPDFSESMDMYENGLATLVPANNAMADLMRTVDPNIRFPYVHADKTSLFHYLLPHGGEHLYDLQAVWDAHIYGYRKLGIKLAPTGNTLGANIYRDLAMNLDYLKSSLDQAGKSSKANYRKRFDPKDRAFREERFENSGWWQSHDS